MYILFSNFTWLVKSGKELMEASMKSTVVYITTSSVYWVLKEILVLENTVVPRKL